VMHFLTLFWKVLFALIPPTGMIILFFHKFDMFAYVYICKKILNSDSNWSLLHYQRVPYHFWLRKLRLK
jgi:hypothetical protein